VPSKARTTAALCCRLISVERPKANNSIDLCTATALIRLKKIDLADSAERPQLLAPLTAASPTAKGLK